MLDSLTNTTACSCIPLSLYIYMCVCACVRALANFQFLPFLGPSSWCQGINPCLPRHTPCNFVPRVGSEHDKASRGEPSRMLHQRTLRCMAYDLSGLLHNQNSSYAHIIDFDRTLMTTALTRTQLARKRGKTRYEGTRTTPTGTGN